MFCFFKVELNSLFINSTPASVWTLVGFLPHSFNTFRNAFNTVGPFLSFSERANPIYENTYMLRNTNVSPSLNCFELLVSHRSICHNSSIFNTIILFLENLLRTGLCNVWDSSFDNNFSTCCLLTLNCFPLLCTTIQLHHRNMD